MDWSEYERLGETVRGEYIDGHLVVGEAPTQRHQRISLNLSWLINAALPEECAVVYEWGWKPDADEFIPDVLVFDRTDENKRYSGVPHLAVEILSSDPAADLLRKAHKYAAVGLERYWVVDPDGPEIIEYRLVEGGAAFVEVGRHSGEDAVSLDVGPAVVEITPAALLD
jgi:Uma2 family endonuclease